MPEHKVLLQNVQTFLKNGYVVYEQVLGEPDLERLREECQRIYEEELSRQNTPFSAVDDILMRSTVFHVLLRKEPVFNFIKQLFGPDISLLSANLRYCKPGTPNQAWHIDYKPSWPISKPDHPLWAPFPTVVAAYYLDDLSLDNGPLWVVPESQVGPHRPEFNDVSLPNEKALLVSAGSVVVFDAKIWHRGGANMSNAPRRAIFFDYSLSWVKKPSTFDGSVIDKWLEEGDEEIRRLLGRE